MSAPVYVTPQCPGCDGAGCGDCGGSGAAREIEGVDRCPAARGGCGLPWRECVCVEAAACAMDVAAGYADDPATADEEHAAEWMR
mgnify:FL=1